MAEFQEVAKMYDRLCESHDECYKCPMFRNKNRDKNDPIGCRYWTLIVDPETAEKVILQWSKEHPTNGMKFREVFGEDMMAMLTGEHAPLDDWLNAEYKGGQE